jgi:hypothetical protein
VVDILTKINKKMTAKTNKPFVGEIVLAFKFRFLLQKKYIALLKQNYVFG